MKHRTDVDFEVKWFPFQLNPNSSREPSSKLEMYKAKFGRSREELMQMMGGMKAKFDAVNLPFRFEDSDLIANTFDAHRVLTAAAAKGAAAQDAAAEIIFAAYFGEGKSPADATTLVAAARAAGLEDPEAFVADANAGRRETEEEFALARKLRVRGVPHFLIREGDNEDGKEVSGAQPPQVFEQVFREIAPK